MDRLVETCRLDIESNEEQIRQLEKFRAEYTDLDHLLETLPQTLNPRVLVPLGSKCGFFHGFLKHTNEITVHLGDNYFSKMTAPQARNVVSKRVKDLDDQIGVLRGHTKQLDEKMDIAKELSTKGSDSQEIKEPYSEITEKEWMEKHRASVAREREAARKEREKAKQLEDPLKKLLEMKDDEEEEGPLPLEQPVSVEKRVKWKQEIEKTHQTVEQGGNVSIKFHHSSSLPTMPCSSSGESIQSPGDVYNMFTSKPKSILKNKTPEIVEKRQPLVAAVAPPPSTAVSDKVVERTPVPLGEIAQYNVEERATRATSRFKRERNIQS